MTDASVLTLTKPKTNRGAMSKAIRCPHGKLWAHGDCDGKPLSPQAVPKCEHGETVFPHDAYRISKTGKSIRCFQGKGSKEMKA